MPKFSVLLSREASAYATVKVEAKSIAEADKLALKMAEEGIIWELSDDLTSEPEVIHTEKIEKKNT
jgi:hypothetical protein